MHRYCLAPRDASIRGLRRGGESWFEAVRLQIGEVNARAGGDRFAYARDVVRKNKVNWFDFVVVTDNAEIPSGAGLLRRAAGSEAEIDAAYCVGHLRWP
jgi:hypothetical protein